MLPPLDLLLFSIDILISLSVLLHRQLLLLKHFMLFFLFLDFLVEPRFEHRELLLVFLQLLDRSQLLLLFLLQLSDGALNSSAEELFIKDFLHAAVLVDLLPVLGVDIAAHFQLLLELSLHLLPIVHHAT